MADVTNITAANIKRDFMCASQTAPVFSQSFGSPVGKVLIVVTPPLTVQLIPAVDKRDGHPVGVLHRKTIIVELLDRPRRRKTALGSLGTMRT